MTERTETDAPAERPDLIRWLTPTDVGFAALRTVALLGAGVWLALETGLSAQQRQRLLALFAAFFVYSAVLYTFLRRARQTRPVFHAALALDLAFLFLLLRLTGGLESCFLLALHLLVALHAFYHGIRSGLLVAGLAVVLALFSHPSRWADVHWPSAAVQLSFLPLVAFSLGLLSEIARRRRETIERLNEELAEQRDLCQAAYDHATGLQEHMLHAEQLATVGKMSAQVAHQIRNPLTSISLNLELMEDEIQEGRYPSAEVDNLLSSIRSEIALLVDVTENYLRMAKPSEMRKESSDLNQIIRELLGFLRPQLQKNEITLTEELDPAVPALWLDRVQIRSAALNVIRNAVEAMEEGGRLKVVTQAINGYVEIRISDTGRGIPRSEQEKIFQLFYSTKDQGTGLGLSMARQIVEEHGGSIVLESMESVGTTIALRLPVKREMESGETRDAGERAAVRSDRG